MAEPADTLTATDLEAIERRADAATEGPWYCDETDQVWRLLGAHTVVRAQEHVPALRADWQILKAPKTGTPYAEYWPSAADAAFITQARTDIPALLRHVRALEEANDAVLRLHRPGVADPTSCHECSLLASPVREGDLPAYPVAVPYPCPTAEAARQRSNRTHEGTPA